MSVLNAKPNTTIAFTDGACKGNPGPGGWGAFLVLSDGQQVEHFGGEEHTTNNQMELMGAIMALEKSPHDQHLEIWTDSSYVKNGITSWIKGWKNKDWKTSANKPVKNKELWQRLDALQAQRDVSWHWVKGHAGHEGNEKADELANRGILSSSESASSNANYDNELKKKLNSASIALNSCTDIESSAQLNEQPDPDNAMRPTSNMNNLENINSQTNHNPKNDIGSEKDNSSKTTTDWLDNDPLGFDESIEDSLSAVDEMDMSMSTLIPQANYKIPSTFPNNELQVSDQLKDDDIKFDGDTSRANPHFKALLPEPINRGITGRQLIMDTETTGLDALKGDRVIEVGIIELINRKFTGEKLHVYINPERGMDDEVIRVHGITEAFLADKPKFKDVAKPLYEFMLGAEVIAHNASFDMSFLSMEFDKVGLTDFAEKITVTDSLVMAKQQYPGQKNTLDALVRRLNVGKMDRTFHGALLDSEILAEVYLAMTGGQVALAIDEDTQSEGEGSHADFSQLASQILSAKSQINDHVNWVAKLLKKYPKLAETQGIGCFYSINEASTATNLLFQKPLFSQSSQNSTSVIDADLANNLFISS
ncbi:DNA polymerase III subunit epsilon [Psychrobacter sp.]|uniref:DNA polymerase III subunit epsilon n=1 Tax=Psychrobacter sp. TaxID=56811 RepID=UPI0025CF6D0A|nr:DNA polymerase III subunit epsilon [Psychrobacter sp.]